MMTFAIELAQAKGQLARLVQEVHAGAEVIITHDGQPVARLVPPLPQTTGERVPGSAKGLFTVPDDFDAPLGVLREYM